MPENSWNYLHSDHHVIRMSQMLSHSDHCIYYHFHLTPSATKFKPVEQRNCSRTRVPESQMKTDTLVFKIQKNNSAKRHL